VSVRCGNRVRRVRVGVAGAGAMGANHARVLNSLPHLCELVAVYDPDHARAQAVAARTTARVCSSLEELLERVDAVCIASPSGCHPQQVALALAAGRDVFVEKPLALEAAAARSLRDDVVRGSDRIVQVGHIEHFNPAVRELRKLAAGEQLVAVEMQRLSPWHGRIADADVIQDLMLHDVHVLLTLARAPIAGLAAFARHVRSADRSADHAVATLAFADGLIAALSASRVTEEKVRRLAVTSERAYITLDYVRRTIEICRSTSLHADARDQRSYRQESVVERVFVPPEEPLVAQLGAFLECVRERRPPEVDVDDAVRCLEVVEALRRSAGLVRGERGERPVAAAASAIAGVAA